MSTSLFRFFVDIKKKNDIDAGESLRDAGVRPIYTCVNNVYINFFCLNQKKLWYRRGREFKGCCLKDAV